MLNDDKINLLARVARTAGGAYVGRSGPSDDRSILTLAAAAYGSRPVDENTVPTGFDPFVAALFECIVEGAYLVATADGVFDDEERAVFERVVTASCGGMVPQRLVNNLVSDLADQLDEDGLDLRVQRIAQAVSRPEHAREVLRIAALIASVSDDVSDVERSVLERLAVAFKLSDGAVDEAIGEAKRSLAIG